MMTDGVTEPANQIRRSFAVSHWLGSVPTLEATLQTAIQWGWLRSCSCSGESQPDDVGGREWNWKEWKAFRGNSRCGSGGCGHWRW